MPSRSRRHRKRIHRVLQPFRRTSLPQHRSLRFSPRMSTTVKIYAVQPQLDVPAHSRIRFPLSLKCLYNIAQMELTTVDPLGAFYLVALEADGKLRPQNTNPNGTFRRRPTIAMPTPYANIASAGPSALTPSLHATSNYNSGLQLIFTRPFVPASAASPSTKSTLNTNSAPGLSLLWIWSPNSRQCSAPLPSRK